MNSKARKSFTCNSDSIPTATLVEFRTFSKEAFTCLDAWSEYVPDNKLTTNQTQAVPCTELRAIAPAAYRKNNMTAPTMIGTTTKPMVPANSPLMARADLEVA